MEIKAYILSVGNEVLSGRVVNTSASFLAKELEKIGIITEKVITVADDFEMIKDAILEFNASSSKILITTGGLGPTHDDFTKEALCKVLGIELEENDIARCDMENYLKHKVDDANYKQLLEPVGSTILRNKIGTADGFVLEHNNKVYSSLVGPVFELVPMYNDYLKPFLLKYGEERLVREYSLFGISESKLEEKLKGLIEKLENVSLCPYVNNGKIRIQITSRKEFEDEYNIVNKEFQDIANQYIVSNNNEEIEEVIVKLLKEKNLHISFAESITGGLLATLITSVSGASNVISESYITYSNDVKHKLLGVSLDTIDKYDVVSREVASEMVKGLHDATLSDVCIAVTGYAGPTGNDVGKVCYAIYYKDNVKTYELHRSGNRDMIRMRSAKDILYSLFVELKENL